MTINKTVEGGKLIIAPEGRLDTMTSPQLDAELDNSIKGVSELVFDFAGLDYISSAILRVLIIFHLQGFVFFLKRRRL